MISNFINYRKSVILKITLEILIVSNTWSSARGSLHSKKNFSFAFVISSKLGTLRILLMNAYYRLLKAWLKLSRISYWRSTLELLVGSVLTYLCIYWSMRWDFHLKRGRARLLLGCIPQVSDDSLRYLEDVRARMLFFHWVYSVLLIRAEKGAQYGICRVREGVGKGHWCVWVCMKGKSTRVSVES